AGPTVTISSPSVAAARSGQSVTYTITYDDPNLQAVTLTAADVTLQNQSGARGTVAGAATGDPHGWIVTISNLTGTGALRISLDPGTATDKLGNVSAAAGPSEWFTVNDPGSGK